MSTHVDNATAAAVERRIRLFYDHFNEDQIEKCYGMLDPSIRHDSNGVTLHQYTTSVRRFREHLGKVTVLSVSIELHEDEPTELFKGRDFAIGTSNCREASGAERTFQERWVRDGRSWFTKCTGYVLSNDSQDA